MPQLRCRCQYCFHEPVAPRAAACPRCGQPEPAEFYKFRSTGEIVAKGCLVLVVGICFIGLIPMALASATFENVLLLVGVVVLVLTLWGTWRFGRGLSWATIARSQRVGVILGSLAFVLGAAGKASGG